MCPAWLIRNAAPPSSIDRICTLYVGRISTACKTRLSVVCACHSIGGGGITVLRRATLILLWLSEGSDLSDHSVVSCPVSNGSLHLQAHVSMLSKQLHARIRNELVHINSVSVRARRNLRLSFLNNGQAHKGSVP